MGGDCLNYGCVPSKALLAAAHAAQNVRNAPRLGVDTAPPQIDFDRVVEHVHGAIATIAPHDSVERFEGLGCLVIQASARFTGPTEVTAGDHVVRARRVVIATGSSPAIPPIPGLDSVPYFTNETLFANRTRPDHLVVIGAGPIGLEMAQAHRRLGIPVTVVEMATLLPKDDPELAAVVRTRLTEEGVVVLEGTRTTAVHRDEDGSVRLQIDNDRGSREITASHLLVATGRRPNIDGLGLETAGIAYERTGIGVDARLRTSNRKVFAIGDVAGGYQFTHMAGYHAGIVIRNALFRLPAKTTAATVPWVTFTDPELAQVGLSEEAARECYGAVRVLRWPFAENDRAVAEGDTTGLVKVVTTPKGRILGAGIVGAGAGEMIHIWTLAIDRKLKIGAMASYIAPYPTRSEAGKRAAGSFYTPSLFSARTRRLVRFLLRLGG